MIRVQGTISGGLYIWSHSCRPQILAQHVACTTVQADLSQPTNTGIKRVQRFMVNPCLAQASLICHTVNYTVYNHIVSLVAANLQSLHV